MDNIKKNSNKNGLLKRRYWSGEKNHEPKYLITFFKSSNNKHNFCFAGYKG